AAMPAPERRKSRRETPWALAWVSLRAARRAWYSSCSAVGGEGKNSSLEQMTDGMGPTASGWASRSRLRTHIGRCLREVRERVMGLGDSGKRHAAYLMHAAAERGRGKSSGRVSPAGVSAPP